MQVMLFVFYARASVANCFVDVCSPERCHDSYRVYIMKCLVYSHPADEQTPLHFSFVLSMPPWQLLF